MQEGYDALTEMARMVTDSQNCVLEVVMTDTCISAQLIPKDIYDALGEEDEYSEE